MQRNRRSATKGEMSRLRSAAKNEEGVVPCLGLRLRVFSLSIVAFFGQSSIAIEITRAAERAAKSPLRLREPQ